MRWFFTRKHLAAAIGIAALIGGGSALLILWSGGSAPILPVPNGLDKLELQLRAYLTEHLHSVRQLPRDAERHAALGLVYLANGLPGEARIAFENAARLNPKEPLAALYSGVATQESGDLSLAVQTYREVVRRFPNFAPGLFRLGDTLLRTGATDEAAEAFRRLIAVAPDVWQGYAGLADTKLRGGHYVEAATLLEKAVELDPKAKVARHLLGLAYRGLGRVAEAERELRRGVNAQHFPLDDGWNVDLYKYAKRLPDQVDLARSCLQSGRFEEAVEILEGSLRWHPDNVALKVQFGEACNLAGKPGRARQLMTELIQRRSDCLNAYYVLTESCLALGLGEEAMAHAERAIQLAPAEFRPYIAKARVLLHGNQYTEALAAFQAALRRDPGNPHILMEMGDLCVRLLDQPLEALSYFKQANQLDPQLVPILVRLTDVYLRLGQTAEARAWLEKVRGLAPEEPVVKVLEARLTNRERGGAASVITNQNSNPQP
jgi:tetratricopeptide (TPR) repeat protein